MITYPELEQRTIEWHEMKWAKVGGTLAKGLRTKGDTLFIDILSQDIEEFEPSDSFQNAAMERGQEMEPFAIEYAEAYTGLKFEQFGWLQSSENRLLGISPDGLTADLKIGIETKCYARKKHTEILLKYAIPTDDIDQVIHYFTVNPLLEKMFYCAFRSESVKSFVEEVTLDTEVNIGTPAKPNFESVRYIRDCNLKAADLLLARINKTKELLKF
jgi:hypothetical protein